MRVLIDTTYARRAPFSGTGVYIRRLCDELAALDAVQLIQVANERRRPPAGGGIGSLRNLLGDLRWTVLELPRLARRHGAELIHHPLPARSPGSRVPQVVTVVDLAYERLPEHFDRWFRLYAHVAHRGAALAARVVICISETTAGDARELWQVPAERIVVAPLGPGQELAPSLSPAQSRPTSSTSAMRNRAKTWDCCSTPTRSTGRQRPGRWSWSWPDPPRRARPASKPLLDPARQS